MGRTVNRSAGATVTWTGGDPAGYVLITGSSSAPSGNSAATASFICTAHTADGSFTVPACVLAALPPNTPQIVTGVTLPTYGFLEIDSNSAYTRFQAPGVDLDRVYSLTRDMVSVVYQ